MNILRGVILISMVTLIASTGLSLGSADSKNAPSGNFWNYIASMAYGERMLLILEILLLIDFYSHFYWLNDFISLNNE